MTMLKPLMLASALALGTAAIAQGTAGTQNMGQNTGSQAGQGTTQPSGQTVDDPSQATGPQGVTQQGTDPNGQASPPPGYNMPPGTTGTGMGTGMGAATGASMSGGEYPPCSRTVTDSCIQTYERGVGGSRARRRGR